MNQLIEELQRLYFLDDQRGFCLDFDDDSQLAAGSSVVLTSAQLNSALAGEARIVFDLRQDDQAVRTLVIGIARATDWTALAELYRGLQEDLELPPPAISVSATAGFQLWLSLAEPVTLAEARRFVEALRATYLADIPLAQLALLPGGVESGSASQVELVPAWCPGVGKWSAFIDPSMGAMFADEPGLDMAPNMERQADMLAALPCVKSAAFRRAVERLAASAPENGPAPVASPGRGGLNVGSHFTDPKSFLLAVMNDPSATADQRLEAAKALLPYFADGGQG